MAQGLLVAEGRVACRLRRRDVDIEQCLACPWFHDFVESRDEARVLCRACTAREDEADPRLFW